MVVDHHHHRQHRPRLQVTSTTNDTGVCLISDIAQVSVRLKKQIFLNLRYLKV